MFATQYDPTHLTNQPTKPNQTKPNQTKTNQNKPNQTKPNLIQPNHNKPQCEPGGYATVTVTFRFDLFTQQ
jgi:hypothetical protein